MNITIKTIPHKEQRYDTCGDWQFLAPDRLVVSVSDTGDLRYNTLLAIHELVEAVLCAKDGVAEASVDHFDMSNPTKDGDDRDCPYAKQHCFATSVERMVAAAMDVSWGEYEYTLDTLER